MDYKHKTKEELLNNYKEKNILDTKKTKKEIIQLLIDNTSTSSNNPIQSIITTESVRESGLDKFYTIPTIAKKCILKLGEKYDWTKWDLVIEPSAGSGSFLLQIPTKKCIGIDISPEHKDIIKEDFLMYNPHTYIYQEPYKDKDIIRQLNINPQNLKNILVLGNPPFGKISSLAVKFFNHAAEWASVIAFIIPKTFRRVSIQNKLNKQFHLVYDDEIPLKPCSFTPPMMVKCCFQIWEKKETCRDIVELTTKHKDWEFLSFGPLDTNNQPTPPEGADFAIRAYGGKCGDIIKDNLNTLRPKSWHWIKANTSISITISILIERFSSLDYSLSKDTARQNSIGRSDLVKLYSDSYN